MKAVAPYVLAATGAIVGGAQGAQTGYQVGKVISKTIETFPPSLDKNGKLKIGILKKKLPSLGISVAGALSNIKKNKLRVLEELPSNKTNKLNESSESSLTDDINLEFSLEMENEIL